ncbi:MAG: hypothetical protein IMF19_09165 [Proteobacteria bacterium]|nr:hypothetical protein [Pseudomonadota bacterium]
MYILPNWNDMRSIVDITKLSEMSEPVPLLERIGHYPRFGKKMVVEIHGYNY